MAPQSKFLRGRTSRDLVRRSIALLAAAIAIGATPLVARALDDEIAPVVSGDVDSSETARPEPRSTERVVRPAPPIAEPEQSAEAEAEAEAEVVVVPAPDVVTPAPETEAPVEVVARPTETPPVVTFPAGPAGSAWEALRQCESGGDYSITNPSGKYRGAYQFDRPTWNSVAERHAPRLVDVDPAAALPADQDAMAFALYTERGAGPWPLCGRHLS